LNKKIARQIQDHLDTTGGIANNQYGFRKGKSTMDALRFFQYKVKKAEAFCSRDNKVVGKVTLDIKKRVQFGTMAKNSQSN